MQLLAAKGAKKQEEQRNICRLSTVFSANATKARQAQSRPKLLSKMEPVAAIVDDAILPIHLLAEKPLPPIIALEKAAWSAMAIASCCRGFAVDLERRSHRTARPMARQIDLCQIARRAACALWR
ncbi:MAG: hypothetical protein U1E25_00080 [Methylocystis sp.]